MCGACILCEEEELLYVSSRNRKGNDYAQNNN